MNLKKLFFMVIVSPIVVLSLMGCSNSSEPSMIMAMEGRAVPAFSTIEEFEVWGNENDIAIEVVTVEADEMRENYGFPESIELVLGMDADGDTLTIFVLEE